MPGCRPTSLPGDLLAVAATGAYCRSMASNYNHVPRPPVVAVATVVDGDRAARDRGRSAAPGHRLGDRGPDLPQRLDVGQGTGRVGVSDALRVALLGCGVVGSQIVRLLHEQADDLAARVGVPLELAGIAVRRPAKHTDLPAELLTTDAAALVARDDVDLVVEVIGGIEPVRTCCSRRWPAGRAWSAPTRRCSPRTAPCCTRRPPGPASTCTTRRRSPARSRCCARCASRWPATGSPG